MQSRMIESESWKGNHEGVCERMHGSLSAASAPLHVMDGNMHTRIAEAATMLLGPIAAPFAHAVREASHRSGPLSSSTRYLDSSTVSSPSECLRAKVCVRDHSRRYRCSTQLLLASWSPHPELSRRSPRQVNIGGRVSPRLTSLWHPRT